VLQFHGIIELFLMILQT